MRNSTHTIFGSDDDAKRFYGLSGVRFSGSVMTVTYRNREWTGQFASFGDGNMVLLGSRMGRTVAIVTADPFSGTW